MSMYDMMTGGTHPMAPLWLGVLGIDPRTILRPRNVYILEGSDPPVIYVLTRSQENEVLANHPRLIADRQAFGGDTYWEFEFSIPDEYLADVKALGPAATMPRFEDHFNAMMGKLKGSPEEVMEDEEARAMIERAKGALAQIVEKLQGGGGVVEV